MTDEIRNLMQSEKYGSANWQKASWSGWSNSPGSGMTGAAILNTDVAEFTESFQSNKTG
jgi:hypothetical protein